MSVLSVDLGTSNTVAVVSAHGRPPRVVEVEGSAAMPSAVFAAEDGRLVVGREAERRARLDPARFEPNPKRRVDEGTLLLGDRVVPVTEAFAAVLGKVAAEVSRQLGGGRAEEVRLTHPAQWGPVRRNVLLSAARQAGLGTNLVLVPEPVAAAAHFASFPGRSLAPGQALAVYDLGAGTFDVAVVAAGYTVLAEAGLPDLGGLDVDQALLTHVGRQVSARDPHAWHRLMLPTSTADRRARRALQEDVRAAKEALSSHPQTDLPLPEPFQDVLVTRAELEALIRPNLLRSVELLSATVRSAGVPSGGLAGVYLVGGSSRIPLVATLIAEQLRIVATNLDQPETAVALGAHFVTPEGMNLRTEALPERTTHIASPPRPPVRQMQSRPPTARTGLSPMAPPAAVPVFGPVTPTKNKAARWPLVLGALLLVIGLVVSLIVWGLPKDEEAGPRPPAREVEAGQSSAPTVVVAADRPKSADPLVCADIMPVITQSETGYSVTLSSDEDSSCYFGINRPGAMPSASTYVDIGIREWNLTDLEELDFRPIDFTENNAFEAELHVGECSIVVALEESTSPNAEISMLDVTGDDFEGDPCVLTRRVVGVMFDHLPDA